jgi:endonuclease/exonuclease/phosphatase family metal-dependent hydrolase
MHLARPSTRPLFSLRAAACAAVVWCGASACGGGYDLDVDEAPLSEFPAMAHIVAALSSDADTFAALFAAGGGLEFQAPPDPSELLRSTAALDDERTRTGTARLRVLNWNVALLDANIFAVIPYAQTPALQERRGALPALALSTGADIITLQEVWLEEDVARFSRIANDAGYEAFTNSRIEGNDGLLTLIKRDALGGIAPTSSGGPFAAQDGLEYFPGPGIRRGFLEVRFRHPEAGPVRVWNTHMQAFPESFGGRMDQARQLGRLAKAGVDAGDLVIVAGDLNAGPYYSAAEWETPADGVQTVWLHNTLSYPTLLAYGGLVDAAVMGRSAEGADSDVVLGDTVVNDAAAAIEIPGAVDGWCEQTPRGTFTASDCNSLYFQQYAGTEYPARLDHIHVGDRPDIVVAQSTVLFDEKLRFGALEVEPSDHLAVHVELLVERR